MSNMHLRKKLGIIEKVWLVTCGNCCRVERAGGGEIRPCRTQAEMVRTLKFEGWYYSEQNGWTCPPCVKEVGF